MITHAERSLDLQYYIIRDDPYATTLLRAVRVAAEHGVRVRILIDDLYTSGRDQHLAWYAARPNVEVRVFNPFPVGRGMLATRILGSLADVARINRRMHNKLFIVDNAFAVTGGRNIGAEYYMHSASANFFDIDLLAAGPLVEELSSSFETYWNSAHAYPIAGLAGKLEEHDDERNSHVQFAGEIQQALDMAILHGGGMEREVENGAISLRAAVARVLADRPSKIDTTSPGIDSAGNLTGDTIARDIAAVAGSANSELLIVSPYFVPSKLGMRIAAQLAVRGVRMSVLTNSLASNDALLAHVGYARYRVPLLNLGVELYELKPIPGTAHKRLGMFGSSKASLHAKILIVDRTRLFIGSFNVDPRSAVENTELGVVIESPTLVAQVVDLIREHVFDGTYRLQLAADGHLQWISGAGTSQQIFDREPSVGTMLELGLRLLSPLAPESVL